MVRHMDPFYCCINQGSLLSYVHGFFYCLTSSFTIVLPNRKFLDVKHTDPFLLLYKSGILIVPSTWVLLLSYIFFHNCSSKEEILWCGAHGTFFIVVWIRNPYCLTHMGPSIVSHNCPAKKKFLDCEAHGPLLLLNKLGNLYCITHMLSSIVLQIFPPYCYHTCFFPHAIILFIHTLYCLHYLGNFFPFLVVYCIYLI